MKIVITLEIDDDTPDRDANELAQAVLSGIEDFDPDAGPGDLREYVKSFGYKISR